MALVGVATYRKVTGDHTSTDGDVAGALADAQQLAEDETHRPLESAARTEQVRVNRQGRAFPLATPVTAVATAGWEISPHGGYLTGTQLGTWSLIAGVSDRVPMTYTGGYTAQTAPQRLVRALVALAWDQLHPAAKPELVGATSVRVGDVAVTRERPVHRPDGLPAAPMASILRFRRRI